MIKAKTACGTIVLNRPLNTQKGPKKDEYSRLFYKLIAQIY